MNYDMTPIEAYWFALAHPDCDIGKYQKIACQASSCAYPFAMAYCWAYYFAKDVPEANIEYCQIMACSLCDEEVRAAYYFARDIPDANIEYCYSFINILTRKAISDFILKDL